MLADQQIELADAKYRAHAPSSRPPLVNKSDGVLTDRRQYTQAAGTRTMISGCLEERIRSCWLTRHTMVHFAPLLRSRTVACPRENRRRPRLVVPIGPSMLLIGHRRLDFEGFHRIAIAMLDCGPKALLVRVGNMGR